MIESEMKISFAEAQVTKLSLNPGDVLGVTVTSDLVMADDLIRLQTQLSGVFPNNKVMVFLVNPNDKLEFTKIQSAEESNCSTTNYCEDCNCGKKEQVEGESK